LFQRKLQPTLSDAEVSVKTEPSEVQSLDTPKLNGKPKTESTDGEIEKVYSLASVKSAVSS